MKDETFLRTIALECQTWLGVQIFVRQGIFRAWDPCSAVRDGLKCIPSAWVGRPSSEHSAYDHQRGKQNATDVFQGVRRASLEAIRANCSRICEYAFHGLHRAERLKSECVQISNRCAAKSNSWPARGTVGYVPQSRTGCTSVNRSSKHHLSRKNDLGRWEPHKWVGTVKASATHSRGRTERVRNWAFCPTGVPGFALLVTKWEEWKSGISLDQW